MSEADTLPPTPSGLPIFGNTAAFVRNPFGFVRDSVASTGDVFRMRLLGKDVYVLGHPDLIEAALLDRESFTKLADFEVAFGEALLSVDGEQWRRQRQAMEDFFSPTRIADHAETMTAIAESRFDGLESGTTMRVDREMQAIALKNLFEVVLGHSPSDDELAELAGVVNALNLWFKPSSWSLPEWVPTPARFRFRRSVADLRDRSRELLAEGSAAPNEESLLSTLAALRDDPNSGFDRSEILDQVVGMVFAGHETTALAMTYALHQIGSHPHVADQFYAELDEVLEGSISAADLHDLEYLEHILNETFRLYPPVHAIPRVTTEPVTIGGYTIPAEAPVLLSVWSLHHDPRFWDNPGTFDPDRWNQTSPRDRGYAFVPFGAGPRICIGRHFARLEATATLATLGRHFRIDAVSDLAVSPKMTTQPDNPVTARLTKRT
jgi:cytochrome P450